MKEESTEARDALRRLKFFEDELEFANMRVTETEDRLKNERERYVLARPLTEAERAELAEHVATGGTLCCSDGLAWLRERLPEPWAQAVNGWAYEYLGCSSSEEGRVRYVERVRALKLDRFP
jgi:hypothetical protein